MNIKNNYAKARDLLKKGAVIGKPKQRKLANQIASIGTLNAYQSCLKIYLDWCAFNEVLPSVQSSKANLAAYLEEQSEVYRQKTLDQHRMALNKAFHKKLPFVESELATMYAARDYKFTEILLLIKNLEAHNAIGILLCYYSGLRAHEIATLQRQDEGSRSTTRAWSDSLFDWEDYYSIYIVTGKGGLRRYVAIPVELAEIIEERRFTTPKKVTDRGIYYHMNYDLGFGKALSQCFSRASLKYLGWSTGLHGTRHSYAKNRIKKLIDCHYKLEDAMLIVSQELGHFRPEIVNCYLR
jgi:integrase